MKRPVRSILTAAGLLLTTVCVVPQTSVAPRPVVDAAFFGLVNNRAERDGEPPPSWPSVRAGSWRLWDSRTTWRNLEPRQGQWQFEQLDRRVREAQAHAVNLLLVLAHAPPWAARDPLASSAYGPGVVSPPARLADWENYVRTVGTRYRGRLTEYQVWNEPSDRTHWGGSIAELVELTCAAHRVLKAIDPAIRIVSPGSNGGGVHLAYLAQFLAAGGAACIDVVAHHLYVFRYGPEAIVPMLRGVRSVMQAQHVEHLPLWVTEIGWWIARTDGEPEHPLVARGGWRGIDANAGLSAYLQRTLLLARAGGADRVYWYAWRNDAFGLAGPGGKAKPGVDGWNRVADVMIGRTMAGCGPDDVGGWQCRIDEPSGQVFRRVRWRDPFALRAIEGMLPASSAGPDGWAEVHIGP